MDSVGSPRREQRDEKEKHGKTNPNRRESDVGDEYPVREHREHSRNFRQDDDEEESHLPPVDETTALIVPPEEDWLLTGSDCSGVSTLHRTNAAHDAFCTGCFHLCHLWI